MVNVVRWGTGLEGKRVLVSRSSKCSDEGSSVLSAELFEVLGTEQLEVEWIVSVAIVTIT